jgi:hypothetical protein
MLKTRLDGKKKRFELLGFVILKIKNKKIETPRST